MLRYSLVLCLAASCYAGVANPTMRLRGGGPLSWSKLVKQPDALKEGYSTESKLEVNTKSDLNGGTSLKSTFIRQAADAISHTLQAKTTYEGVDIEASIDNKGKITAEASFKDTIPGAEIVLKADLDGGQKIKDIGTPRLNAEYRKGDIIANVAVHGAALDAAAVVEAGDIQVGLTTSYDSNTGKLSEPSIAARYSGSGFAVTAVSSGLKGDDVSATYTQSVNDKLDVAGTFSTSGNKFSAAAAYKLDSDSGVRGKVNSDGIVNLGYSRQVTKGASISAGVEVDTNDVDKKKFGLSLKLQ